MLIKDHIKIVRLVHTTKDMTIGFKLNFAFNASDVSLGIEYTPDTYKIEQSSLTFYIAELLASEKFDIESLGARVVEDLYDVAVPKKIKVELEQKISGITTKVSTQKCQPRFK
ncbi:MAG: hypothetical protein GY793_05150 [Proteobacteria bacterium]|nr:hypothetical protein [Pseudomonadota bacterium]